MLWQRREDGHSRPIVRDLNGHLARSARDANRGRTGFCMAVDVGEGLLDDTENSEFNFLREATESLRHGQIYGEAAALGEKFRIGPQARSEADLVH